MSLVTVTGNVWDSGRIPVPAANLPGLWFQPDRSAIAGSGLIAGVEVKANLTVASGAFTVKLESGQGCRYKPVLRWRNNPAESKPENWVWEYAEWPSFDPGPGGDITDLTGNPFTYVPIAFGHGAPPAWLPLGMVYFDTSSRVGVDVWSDGRVV